MLAHADDRELTLSAESSVAYDVPKSSRVWNTKEDIKCHVLDWYSKKHSRVVRSTYAAELLSLLDAANQGQLLQTCLHEIVRGAIPAIKLLDEPRPIPMDLGVDAKAVFDSVTARHLKTRDDKHLILHARALREFLESGHVDRLYWFDTNDMLLDGLTKGSIDRASLIACCLAGLLGIMKDKPIHWSFKEHREEVTALFSRRGLKL